MKTKPVGLYVHIPFCLAKCNYCDFCSYPNLDNGIRKAYISRLAQEILSYKRKEKITVDTIFFGGGTPSLLEPEEFFEIHDAIRLAFDIAVDVEFTLESNPKTVSLDKLKAYISRGVNRISIGLQSIHYKEQKKLGRIHNFEDFSIAYEMVIKSGINNISVDVMYGIPEQTKESFKETLETLISFAPNHISAYGLILEENTQFWNNKSVLKIPSEDEECDMYYLACELLSKAGYSHYEISNYAKQGFESRHNMKYWRMDDFIGVGVAAYSLFEGRRFGNSRNISEYISQEQQQYITDEKLEIDDLAFEYVMLGLRTADGISTKEYKRLFGTDFLVGRREKINSYIKNGYMLENSDRLCLTERGFYVSNTILTDLL